MSPEIIEPRQNRLLSRIKRIMYDPKFLVFAFGFGLIYAGVATLKDSSFEPLLGSSLSNIVSVFILGIGIQSILWAIGIRLEIFGTAIDSEEPVKMSVKFKQATHQGSFNLSNLLAEFEKKIEIAEQNSFFTWKLEKGDELQGEKQVSQLNMTPRYRKNDALRFASEYNDLDTIFYLSYILEDTIVSLYTQLNKARMPASMMNAVSVATQEKFITSEVYSAYREFWYLRNAMLHKNLMFDNEFQLKTLVDLVTRLQVLLSMPTTS